MSFPYPDKPWYDGQTVTTSLSEDIVMKGTYYADKNLWAFTRTNVNAGVDENGDIYTPNVKTVNVRPLKGENTPFEDIGTITSQQEVNWHLYDLINANQDDISKVVYYDGFPPDPELGYIFWFNTAQEYLLIDYEGEWYPVSVSPADFELLKLYAENIQAQLDSMDLERVLTQGNAADKGILLTDAEDALIALAPNEALIDIASDTSKKNPRLRLTHVDKLNYPDSQAQIELDQDGTRVDFEFDQAINDVHFRFDDTEKFVLNKGGDAQFIGKVEGEPGTQNNEFVTYGQLTTLEEEIEQLAPSLERGSWTFTLNHPPGPGEYTMISGLLSEEDQQSLCTQEYTQCYADNMDDPVGQQQCSRDLETCQNAVTGDQVLTTDDWTQCEQLVFNPQDSKGVTHEWAGIDSDHYIDVFNEADEGFMVGDIATHGGGTFAFDLVSSRGVASGLASVKIFKAEGEVDFDQYVRKAGDDMDRSFAY